MDIFEYLCKHPLNSLVSERGGKQNGGFIVRGTFRDLHRNGRDYVTIDKTFPLEGITESLKVIFWPNYRAPKPVSLGPPTKPKSGSGYRGRGGSRYGYGNRYSPRPYQKVPSKIQTGPKISGRERGSQIHQEIQIASKIVSVQDNDPYMSNNAANQSSNGPSDSRASKQANLNAALAITSTVLSSNGNKRHPTMYTEAILASMLTIWNWRPLDAEFTVGDVRADPKTRHIYSVGKFATRIDFVGFNVKSGNLILGELKSGYNAGGFHASNARMRSGLHLDNSPFNQAKVQLVMGACMLVTQFGLSEDLLYLQRIELFIIHCPTRAGETVKANLISPDEVKQIRDALYATGTLVAGAPVQTPPKRVY